MPGGSSPTVKRRRLGIELRQLREAAGVSIEEAAKHLDVSYSTVSRIETGRVRVRVRDLRDLLDLYGVADERKREALFTLAREAREKGWWHSYSDVLSTPHAVYIGLEAEAAAIRTYQTQLIPGLLQTEEYARAIVRGGRRWTTHDEIEKFVQARMSRQKLLTRADPLEFWAILDEAALRRHVGGAKVMRDQLQRLLEAAEQPNITIQVLPFTTGTHAAMTAGSFVILEFPEQSDPEVVYLENPLNSFYLEREHEIRWYTLTFDHLRASALSSDESVALIREVAKDL